MFDNWQKTAELLQPALTNQSVRSVVRLEQHIEMGWGLLLLGVV